MVFLGADVLESVLVVLQDLFVEDIVDIGGEVRAEVPGNEHPALFVKDVDG